ncbi:Polyferredoxin [Halanaeroarchaeum sp. HSR-CO]|uniref:4Fe-4S binding protein n=1 Tax=Halanaeroarchaeum sp. HSR-CO TaxID=2866382 RepID=UPI00217E94F5|nr:4Fe-4S binding protein [Halanaeroarchaeum sp. HSR-CO]UWG49076.1 Polyferredoxin [Halanaeroarchaeum sp. HSR-CO]
MQLVVTVLLAVGGLQFVAWVAHFRYGTPYVPLPSSVEAFLPLSALVGVKAWVSTGYVPAVHPAAFVLFVGVLATAVVVQRGVCSWACPVGFLQERLRLVAESIGISRRRPPELLDWGLRSIKYLVLAFFLQVIAFDFSGADAIAFLQSPYNAVSAVKMLDFWLAPSPAVVVTVGLLVLGTVFVEDVWCRYLCPYGALLAIVGRVSPVSIDVERDRSACTDCGACTRACPNRIAIDELETVSNLECTRCSTCIETCPEDALTYSTLGRRVSPLAVGLAIVVLVGTAVLVGMATGHWNSAVSYHEWGRLIQQLDTVGHPPY